MSHRIILYNGLIQSTLDYCCVVWGNTTEKNLDKIFILQKRALRTLFELPNDYPSLELFSSLNVMSIRQRIVYFMGVLTFRCMTGSAPEYLCKLFVFQSNVHCYQTRSVSRQDCYLPKSVLSIGQRSFHYRAAKLWNSLPNDIRYASNIVQFKTKLKEFIRQNIPL